MATWGSAISPFGLFWKDNLSLAKPLKSFDEILWKNIELSLSNSVVTLKGGLFWKENSPNDVVCGAVEGLSVDGGGGGAGGWGWKEEGSEKRIREFVWAWGLDCVAIDEAWR